MTVSKDNTFVYLKPDEQSIKKLIEHYKDIPGLQEPEDFHSTILEFWIPTPIPADICQRKFRLNPKNFKHRISKNLNRENYALQLCYYHYGVKQLHNKLLEDFDTKHSHKYFLQHMTISYGVDKIDPNSVPLPEFEITLGEFSGNTSIEYDINTLEDEINASFL